MSSLLVFGGTFDPIHNGHVNAAIAVQKHFHFDRFVFMPCKIPLLKKQSTASPQQRLDMLQLAINEHPGYRFEVDAREILRDSPSYMATTLEQLREELGENCAITLLLGLDSFQQLSHWHEWEKIIALSNLLVIDRPGLSSHIAPQELIPLETENKETFCSSKHGVIFRFNSGTYDISSTSIRASFSRGKKNLLDVPKSVMYYIAREKIY